MTKQEFVDLLKTMAEGWNEGDSRKAADCFANGVRYGDPTRYLLKSREELYEFFGGDKPPAQKAVWHHIVFDEEAQMGVAEYTYDEKARYHGLVLVKVANGKVTHWREYQHVSPKEWEEFVGETRF